MIYPTPRAVVLAAAGGPLALAAGVLSPGAWLVGLAWVVMAFGLCLADAVLAADRWKLELDLQPPAALAAGGSGEAVLRVGFRGSRAPAWVEVALDAGERVAVDPVRTRVPVADRTASAAFRLIPRRRGQASLERLWVRWIGPLGLVWKQRVESPGLGFPILPDIASVKEAAIRLFSRDAAYGMKSQLDTGQGSEFHALREFQAGMESRTVDWRRSARHGLLVAKEFRTERNHNLVLALDGGRLMCAPLLGLPRIDRALNAALLLAFVGLRLGDRVGLFSFDARPRLSTGAVSGPSAFPLLQKVAAQIDYSAEETNFTLGLTQLGSELERRSLVVVFTDFADSTSAELMLENLGRLLSRHLVLFVVFRDEELEAMTRAEPRTPDDVSRAVIAHTLLREREVVVGRLRRMGVQIVDAPAAAIGPALLDGYLDLKRRELL